MAAFGDAVLTLDQVTREGKLVDRSVVQHRGACAHRGIESGVRRRRSA